MDIKEIKSAIRETRKEMKAKGIKRIACFNGGLHGEVYSLNARMFALETQLLSAQAKLCNDCGHFLPRHLLGCPSDTHQLSSADYAAIAARENLSSTESTK